MHNKIITKSHVLSVALIMLLAAPVSGIFAAGGVAMFIALAIATRLHPRLGQERPVLTPVMRPEPAVVAQDAL